MVHVLTVSSITFQLKNNMIVREIYITKDTRKERIYVDGIEVESGLLINLVSIAY